MDTAHRAQNEKSPESRCLPGRRLQPPSERAQAGGSWIERSAIGAGNGILGQQPRKAIATPKTRSNMPERKKTCQAKAGASSVFVLLAGHHVCPGPDSRNTLIDEIAGQ